MQKVTNYLIACIVLKRQQLALQGAKWMWKLHRCKMDVEIVGETGHIVASVFGLPAETLLLRSSKQVMELEQEGKKSTTIKYQQPLARSRVIVQVRSQSFTQQGKPQLPTL